jgi:metal-responsive CopG/Arc/MetJ family transcriptional regulator
MRTTVELKPEHRSRLIAIAAKRGEKGFSSVLNEAVESYLSEQAERDARRQRALRLRGILKHDEAAELQKNTASLRANWR